MPIIKIPARVPRSGKSVMGPTKRPKKGPKMVPNKTPPPPQRRRDSSSSLSSPANLSDDDGYSALEDASDSEDDDEEHVFAAEEEHILSRQRHHKRTAARGSPRSSSDYEDDEAADADDDDSGDDDAVMDDHGIQNIFNDRNAIDDNSSESESWNGLSVEEEQAPYPVDTTLAEQSGTSVERHVRFAGVPDSGSDSDETDELHGEFDDLFPDIFVAQDSLDSTFRREIEQDDEIDSDASFTYWDHSGGAADFEGFSDLETPQQKSVTHQPPWDGIKSSHGQMLPGMGADDAHEHGHSNVTATGASTTFPDSPGEEEEDDESDGYETDGETTEEDEPVSAPPATQTPQRRASSKASDAARGDHSGDDKSPAVQPSSSRRKPICVLNPHTRKMMIFTPRSRRTSQLFPNHLLDDMDFSQTTNTQSSPLTSEQQLFRMGGWRADGSFASINAPLGFLDVNDPFWSTSLQIGPASESSSFQDDEEEDPLEKDIDIHQFVTFEGEDDEDDDNAEEGNTDGADTPSRRPSVAASSASESNNTKTTFSTLLEHFNKCPDSVGAFRLNQTNQKLLSTGVATKESLAFSSPFFDGTLRGIKHGSLEGAATPLTPERRHKKASSKRKASGTASDHSHAHKKQRSITDVSGMQI